MQSKFHLSLIAPALAIVVLFAGCAGEAKKAERARKGIDAHYISGDLGDLLPTDTAWQQAPEATVALLPQDLTDPKQVTVNLSEIRVRALCSTDSLAFRIEWEDATQDTIDTGRQFSDAVAIQLPPAAGGHVPDPTMGQADKPVHIHMWKASYQRGATLEDWDLRQLFPNASVDHYPFEAAQESEKESLRKQYTIALAAGNPLANERSGGVDDLIAHGFGTITHLPEQASKGWSDWENGRWSVVISRPLSHPGWPGGEGLKPGQNSFVAFAVWDGSQGQAGSRKLRTAWVPLTLGGGS